MGKTFKVALALVGLTVGAGFASGQEVIQYFLSFGYWGIVGAAVAGISIAVFSGWVYQLGSYYLADDHSAVFKSVSRPWIAKYMDITTMFTLFCIGFVMVAGAGANLNQQFGLPTWVGSAIMVVLLLLSGLLDVDKLTSVISFITPLLIVCLLGAFVITLTNMPDNIGQINEIAQTNPHASGTFGNWLITALNYATLVMIMDTSMMLVFAGSHMNPAQAGKGGLLGGIMFAVLLLILTFVLFMNMENVMGADLPLLKVFDNMHPTVGVFVSIVIYLMIYNTAVGLFYALGRRLSHDNPKKFRPYYGIVVLIGVSISLWLVVQGVLGVPITAASVLRFLVAAALFQFAAASLGVLLATIARSMPQFGLLVILVVIPLQLLSGAVTPRESMPEVVQNVMLAAPTTHFVELAQAILFRGAGPAVVWPQMLALGAIGSVFFIGALSRLRKSLH